MAASLQRDDDDLTEAHEINVTPFIDVMLVLLIIFMVAAPLSTVDVAVDLPASTANPQPRPDKPLFLSVQKDLQLSLGDETVARETLAAALDQATKGDKQARIFLRADRAIDYGALMDVMNLLRTAGYLKVALVGLESPAPAPSGIDADAAGRRP
jgi:biopolymer transport protein ExbD